MSATLTSPVVGNGRPITYLLPDGRRCLDCPVCGQAVKVELHGTRLALRCFADCPEDQVLAGVDVDAVAAEVRATVRKGGSREPTFSSATSRLTTGTEFILEAPEEVPAVWGDGTQVLWASGEPLYIVAPPGVGKTTIGQQLALKRHGIGDSHLLGAPIATDPKPVLYIAADRPQQARRSFARMVDEGDRRGLDDFRVWPGPLPFDLVSDPPALAAFALELGVGTVFIDSLKDVALDLTSDESGSRVNVALQHCVAQELEVCVLHHQRKASSDNRTPRTHDDVYGSTWLTAGAGSVLLLWGKPGDPIVDLRHLKQPVEEFGPVSVIHDHDRGQSKLHEPADLVALAGRLDGGLTVEEAAKTIFGTNDPERNQREKARRRLEGYVAEGLLRKVPGSRTSPAYYLQVAT